MNQPIQVPFRQNREGLCLPNKVNRDIHLRNCTTPCDYGSHGCRADVELVTTVVMDVEPITRNAHLDLDLFGSTYRHSRHLSENQLVNGLEFILFFVWVEDRLCHFMLQCSHNKHQRLRDVHL